MAVDLDRLKGVLLKGLETIFPLLSEEGWLRDQQMPRSLLIRSP
jgi:hypothetical protein